MNAFGYLIRSIYFHRRTHVGIFLGVTLTSAVICTALLIGDSVRGTLTTLIERKLQRISSATPMGGGFFKASLVDRMRQAGDVAALLQLDGAAIGKEGRRINRMTVLGVDRHFFEMGTSKTNQPSLMPFETALNRTLADRLQVMVGDEVLLRLEKPGLLPGDAPLSLQSSQGHALRVTVAAIIDADQLGDFSLRNATSLPMNAFLDREWLAKTMELAGKANLITSTAQGDELVTVNQTVKRVMELEDVGLILAEMNGKTELQYDGIFLPDPVTKPLKTRGEPIFTYFANGCTFNGRTAPYFFVCGAESMVVEEMGIDDAVINQWLADDLGLKVGDVMKLVYFVMNPRGGLRERPTELTVHKVVPTVDRRDLMPAFPGMADADSCSDWDAGLPIDLDTIRQKDEEYWDTYQGTPKVYVRLNAAKALWGNRFGQLTAIRFDGTPADVRSMVSEILKPKSFGLNLVPVRDQRLAAGRGGVDFGGLFIGLSFFIIVAALALVGLLFAFGVESRSEESATLSATGFSKRRIALSYVSEGMVLAIPAALFGAACAIGLNRLVLDRISSVWKGTVNSMQISGRITPSGLAIGVCATLVVAFFTLFITARRSVAGTVRQAFLRGAPSKRSLLAWTALILFGGGAIALVVVSDASGGKDVAMQFMGAGFCMLLALIALYSLILRALRVMLPEGQGTVIMVIRTIVANPNRNVAVVGIMAVGIFLISGVSANRFDPMRDAGTVRSGTGGYDLFAHVSIPILERLDEKDGLKRFQLDEPAAAEVTFHQVKVKPGADASCLNLSKVMDPGVLGVDSQTLHAREAFSFAKVMGETQSPWTLLQKDFDDGAIPVIADMNVILWSLGKGVGDTLDLVDGAGNPYKVRFVAGLKNSVFQGWILMDRNRFASIYPDVSGSNVLLIDGPEGEDANTAALLRDAFRDSGIELEPTRARLARFNRVENTYLEIFQALGGLGLLIGTIGLAIVVSRNVLERRAELAVMRAVGFSKRRMGVILFVEHAIVFVDGVFIGIVSGLVAIVPAIGNRAGDVPWQSLAIQTVALMTLGLVWIGVGCRMALRGSLISALRNE